MFFWFFEGLWLEKITKNQKKHKFFFVFAFQNKKKTKKHKDSKKKHLLRLNKKVSSKFFLVGFEVLRLLSFCTYYKFSDIPR